jgi:hypothetical protein
MTKRVGSVILECFLDLGVTIVYAAIAGFLIAAVVASDDGTGTFPRALLYASLLPAAVVLLIAGDLAMRLFGEWRMVRARRGRRAQRAESGNGALRLSRP